MPQENSHSVGTTQLLASAPGGFCFDTGKELKVTIKPTLPRGEHRLPLPLLDLSLTLQPGFLSWSTGSRKSIVLSATFPCPLQLRLPHSSHPRENSLGPAGLRRTTVHISLFLYRIFCSLLARWLKWEREKEIEDTDWLLRWSQTMVSRDLTPVAFIWTAGGQGYSIGILLGQWKRL